MTLELTEHPVQADNSWHFEIYVVKPKAIPEADAEPVDLTPFEDAWIGIKTKPGEAKYILGPRKGNFIAPAEGKIRFIFTHKETGITGREYFFDILLKKKESGAIEVYNAGKASFQVETPVTLIKDT